MAEGLLRHALAENGCSDVAVSSVGTWAYHGNPAMPEAVTTLEELGIDISEHHSRPIDPEELNEAALIVAMTSVHLRELKELFTEVMDKVVLLKELAEIDRQTITGPASGEDRLKALLGGSRPRWRRALDVDDPIGKPIGAYRRTVEILQEGVDVLAETLCP